MRTLAIASLVCLIMTGCIGLEAEHAGLTEETAVSHVKVLEAGRSPKTDAYLLLGRPTLEMDQGRVTFFRIGAGPGGSVLSMPGQGAHPDWTGVSHSVVVMSDDAGYIRCVAVAGVHGRMSAGSLPEHPK